MPRYDGSFEVIQRVGQVAYRLKLPDRLKVYSTFHVRFLKPFHEDLDKEKVQEKQAPLVVMKQFDREVEKVLNHITMGASQKNRHTDLLVQWKGIGIEEATWERYVTLWKFKAKVQEYLQNKSKWASTSTGGGRFVSSS